MVEFCLVLVPQFMIDDKLCGFSISKNSRFLFNAYVKIFLEYFFVLILKYFCFSNTLL